jgi:hypothetical protein
MRLGISLQVAGSENKKSASIQRPMTTAMYLNFVNNLQISEQIKEKFRALVAKMPSPALRSVVNNIHEYNRRFEVEVHQELMGISTLQQSSRDDSEGEEQAFAVPAFDPTKLAAKAAKFKLKLKQGIETTYGTNIEEADQEEGVAEEEIQIKWVNACKSEDQGGPGDQREREDHRLHADLPDGTICHGGFTGELHTGREQPPEVGAVVAGEWDDRLRPDADGAEGFQGGDNPV